MFSPIGYTSLASLWASFVKRHYLTIYSVAANDYAGGHAWRSYQLGTPADICEHLFWKSVVDHTVVVANSEGVVANVMVEIDRQFQSLHHVASVFESSRIAVDPAEAGENAEWLEKFGSVRFVAWNHWHDDAQAWSNEFPVLNEEDLDQLKFESAPFCTLPFAFERSRFTVPHFLPPWASDAWAKDYIRCFVDNFAGWSFCLNDKDLVSWEKTAKRGVLIFASKAADTKAGRPRKVDYVAEQIQLLFPDNFSDLPVKLLNQSVIDALGEDVSVSTVKRAIKILKK